MTSAGMRLDSYPAASADDALDRESIVKLSMQRAAERYEEEFGSIVYVGDGVWDARACRELGIPFIGIASGEQATQLASEGAVRVFQDFSKSDLFLESLYCVAQAGCD
jgi:phosphoglycolate phosphatase-like HAD superfamily hydrolase